MGATYKLKHKKADGTIEEVAVPISSVDGLQTALDGKQPSGSYVTTNTAQTISGAKTLTNTLKIQSGNPAGAFVLGGNVSSTGLTANTRKLGRMGVPAYTSNGSTVTSTVAGISFDAQANANYADFGGHPRNTSSIAPDVIRFVVADSHDNNVAGNRTLAFQIAKQIVADSVDGATSFAGAKFFVPVEATGTIKATGGFVGDLTGTADDADKLGGQLPAYYLNYNNLTNKPTIPTATSQLSNDSGFLTEETYKGTVTGVKVGSTSYSPTNGVVSLPSYVPLAGGSMNDGATLKFSLYGNRFVTIGGNSITADMSQTSGGWAGTFAGVKHKDSSTESGTKTTTMLGWYGGDSGLTHIFMGGTYNDPAMKMTPAGQFTFKNAPKVGTTSVALATNATQSKAGLMSADDKKKLDGIGESGSAEPFIVTFTNDGNNNYTIEETYEDIEQAFANGKIVIGVDSTNSYIYQIFGLSDDDTIPFSRIVNWEGYGTVVETLFVNTDDSVSYARNTLGGGSSSGGDADTFVVHFAPDGTGDWVADQSFDEIYSKIQDGKMPFAELENTSLLCYHHSINSIAFRSIEPYVGSGVDGDDSFIDIHYISLSSSGYAGDWWRTIKIPSGSQGSGAGQQSVTYAKLKELRDDGKLVAGMRYRIVDFVTTTSQPDTQSAGHPFNIIVTALSNTTLSENASADLPSTKIANDDGSLAQGSVMPFYYVFEDFAEGGDGTMEGYKATDEFIAYDYLENGDGVVVPVIYKTDAQGAIDSPEEFGEPDYEDIFYYEGTMEVDGVTYDKWRKICESQEYGPFWDGSTGSIWVLTNIIVQDGQIGGAATDPYFANANLPAWEIKYCLDNDKTRFAWADEGSIEAIKVYSADDESDYIYVRTPDGDNENGIAWCYIIDSEGLEFSDIGDWNNYAGDDVIYTEAETVTVGDFLDMSGIEVEVLALKYGNGGKGVIYYMKDEWDNECHYDFKNIQFKRSGDWFAEHSDWAESVWGYTPVEDKWFYTFTWVDENGEVQDLTLIGNTLLDDGGKISGVYGNKIGICSEKLIYLDESSVEALPRNVIISAYYYDSVFYGCYSNTFANDCIDNTFGHGCINNTFGHGCTDNTFGHSCTDNTFGKYCSSNTFGDGCSSNNFGYSCSLNTFGNDCLSNTFSSDCSSITFGQNCSYNTFGRACYNNSFGSSCAYIIFGDDCYYNTLSEWAKYNIFESRVSDVTLTSATQGNWENLLRYITVSQGIHNKTINATRNLAYKTTYVAKGSVTTEV